MRKRMNMVFRPILNEKGIALIMVLVVSAMALAMMTALVYMLSTGAQITGMTKRYRTAFEAGLGGTEITYQVIASRGNPGISGITANMNSTDPCFVAKLRNNTSDWPAGCDKTITFAPGTDTSIITIPAGPTDFGDFTVYSKITHTIEGNSGGDEGLTKGGVVTSTTGEVQVIHIPFLYSIETQADNTSMGPTSARSERARISALYQY